MPARLAERGPALLALAIPVLAGLGYLSAFGAPSTYLTINAAAFGLGALWIVMGRAPRTERGRRVIMIGLLAALYLPLLTGPQINEVARWIPLGPFAIHSGALLLPALTVLAAQEDHYAPPILLTAIFAGVCQPDAALGFAVVFAAIGLHDVTRNWRVGVVCIIGFIASIAMALLGELPPQPFVERVLSDLFLEAPLVALGLLSALIASFFLILFAAPFDRSSRYALAGSLFGFTIVSIFSNYPSVLIGYGAAPILGYGLALGLSRDTGGKANDISEIDERTGRA